MQLESPGMYVGKPRYPLRYNATSKKKGSASDVRVRSCGVKSYTVLQLTTAKGFEIRGLYFEVGRIVH